MSASVGPLQSLRGSRTPSGIDAESDPLGHDRIREAVALASRPAWPQP
ncbi:hypothetical protein GMORB2_6683 [Geosmithia morbida]|uniref:Uncharacterized protein n=1 Tax=Geosmithia morbida TaxID=1094350 RepID=A0A9P4YUP6_9HYPO|nr:uncharacterized protein GMORB2_6683 [Geosmithia morbida]KAF4123135.1 hypothetical protein GMORB2_6683 [Geosmithia morbida]